MSPDAYYLLKMSEQIYFDDVDVGSELTPLVKQPTTRQLVMYAGASGDYNPIHYDKDYAISHGLTGVIVPGQLVACFLGQMLYSWAGIQGFVIKLSCSYKGMNYPGETITCRGKITKKATENHQNLVECAIWAENPKGEQTVTGRATVVLPTRTVVS